MVSVPVASVAMIPLGYEDSLVVPVTVAVPDIAALPPTLRLPLMPSPPVMTAVPVVVDVDAILSVKRTPAAGLVPLDVARTVRVPLAAVEPCTVGVVKVVPTVPVPLTLKSDDGCCAVPFWI